MLKRKTIVKVKIRPLIHTLLITISLRYSVHTGVWLMKCFNLLFCHTSGMAVGCQHKKLV